MDVTDAPQPKTHKQRTAAYRQTHRDALRTKQRSRVRKQRTARPFLAWDGEGITRDDGTHDYVLFMNSLGDYITDTNGLSFRRIARFVLDTAVANPGAIHVIYGGGYDWNMWLKTAEGIADDDWSLLRQLYDGERSVPVEQYRLTWRTGKTLHLSRSRRESVTMYDVVSFFQTSFVRACDSYLGDRFVDRDLVADTKLLRGSFTESDLPHVIRYTTAELTNLVRLMNELRDRLEAVDMAPRRWDGPGAIAATLLRREGVDKALSKHNPNPMPDALQSAIRTAYAGGRFEMLKWGRTNQPVYEYDVNSAYPRALIDVPNLADGEWTHDESDDVAPFALYHVTFTGDRDAASAYPLFKRETGGRILYPREVTGWYWTPEYEAVREYVDNRPGSHLRVHSRYVYASTSPGPFRFIPELYAKRQALKAAGNGAHVGIKLGLNSLYGKLAQQSGWREDEPDRIPPFHELAWAGYTTSWCRARVFRATLSDPTSVVAFETDAVFTTRALKVPHGNGLGEWERTVFRDLAYMQSGMYFGHELSGKGIDKTRGVNLGTLSGNTIHAALDYGYTDDGFHVTAAHTRFIGAGLALNGQDASWCRWITTDKHLRLEPLSVIGKRFHMRETCRECAASPGRIGYGFHDTIPGAHVGGIESCEHHVVWVHGQHSTEPDVREDDNEGTYE